MPSHRKQPFTDRVSDAASDLHYRLRALVRRRRMERELDDELRFHIEQEAAKYVRQGMSPADALRRARVAFGGVEVAKEGSRDARGVALVDGMTQDLRYAWRALRAKPGFTLAVVLTLGLGIGVNAAMFGVVDRLLFRPPAYLTDPAHTHRVYLTRAVRNEDQTEASMEYTRYRDLTRATADVFTHTAAVGARPMAVGDGDDARELMVATVSATLFAFFDARPALGRFFGAHEDAVPVGAPVVVLSHTYWRTHFGGRADVVGRTIRVSSLLCTIIGVAPEGFVGIADGAPPALFIPITTFAGAMRGPDAAKSYYTDYSWGWLNMLARRKPGVPVEAATASLTRAYVQSWEAERVQSPSLTPVDRARPRAVAAPVAVDRGPNARAIARVATWVAGVALVVLVVACANVANLLLARALARRREIGVRLALGAGRGRLVRQLLTESLLLALLGGAAGLAAAQVGGAVLRRLFLPAGVEASAVGDARTLVFTALAALAAALLTGLAPALQAGREDLATTLKSGARDGVVQRSRTRTVLLVVQGALSVVLLVGAGLFVRSLGNVRALRLGYDVDPILLVMPNMRGAQLPPAERLAVSQRMLESAQAMPGVEAATLASSVPFWSNWGQSIVVPGIDSVQRLGRFTAQAGTADYFRTMGTRILRGRAFTDADRDGAPPVAIVSDGMARALWPDEDALGKCFRVRRAAAERPCMTVVGVAENIKQNGLGDDQRLQFYLPILQNADVVPGIGVFARVRDGDAARHAEALRQRLQPLVPGGGRLTARAMSEIVGEQTRGWRVGAWMFAAFGALALLVAAIGTYAVIAYDVARRTRDIGIRVTLGAGTGDILRHVLGAGVRVALVGIVIGVALALAAGRLVAPLLFGTSPKDPVVFGVVAAVLLVVSLLASFVPARRAARVDPSVALRAE